MSIANMVRRMGEAGASPEAIAIAIEEIEALQTALNARRTADRDRKRAQRERQKTANVTGQSEDSHGTVTPEPSPLSSPPKKAPDPKNTPPLKSPQPGEARGSRLPPGFSVPDEWKAWARTERNWSQAEVDAEAASFVDHWHAKPGKDGRKLDWAATWRNWVRNSRRRPSANGPPSDLDVLIASVDRKYGANPTASTPSGTH